MIGQRSAAGLLPQARIGRRAAPSGLLPQPRVGRRSGDSLADSLVLDAAAAVDGGQQEVAENAPSDTSPLGEAMESIINGGH